MTYCTDEDLVSYRPNILNLGVANWNSQRTVAYEIINRVLEARWYRAAAEEQSVDWRTTLFDPTLVETNLLKRLEVFKALELAYMYLKKDSQDADGFARLENDFRARYNEELDSILSIGISYDWDKSGTITDTEKYIVSSRRQHRS